MGPWTSFGFLLRFQVATPHHLLMKLSVLHVQGLHSQNQNPHCQFKSNYVPHHNHLPLHLDLNSLLPTSTQKKQRQTHCAKHQTSMTYIYKQLLFDQKAAHIGITLPIWQGSSSVRKNVQLAMCQGNVAKERLKPKELL